MRRNIPRAPKGFREVYECEVCNAVMPLEETEEHTKLPADTLPKGFVCKEGGYIHIFLPRGEISQLSHGEICDVFTRYPKGALVVCNCRGFQYSQGEYNSRRVRIKLGTGEFTKMSDEEAQKLYRGFNGDDREILREFGIGGFITTLPPDVSDMV